jgi:predicted acetyltransferase
MKQLLLVFNLLLLVTLPNNLFCAHAANPLQKIVSLSSEPMTITTSKGDAINLIVKPFTEEEREVATTILAKHSCFLPQKTTSDTCIKIYDNNNAFIGFMLLNSNSSKAGEKYISDFFIDTKSQKRGIGCAVFQHVQSHIFPKINVFRLCALPNSVSFYTKLGFRDSKSPQVKFEMVWSRPYVMSPVTIESIVP